MQNDRIWETRYRQLVEFANEHGHTCVPSRYISYESGSAPIKLGNWVGYLRTRYRRGLLPEEQVKRLESLPGWEWGPLSPGPDSDPSRDATIAKMRQSGMSLAAIGEQFGISRQRVHQIVGSL